MGAVDPRVDPRVTGDRALVAPADDSDQHRLALRQDQRAAAVTLAGVLAVRGGAHLGIVGRKAERGRSTVDSLQIDLEQLRRQATGFGRAPAGCGH